MPGAPAGPPSDIWRLLLLPRNMREHYVARAPLGACTAVMSFHTLR